jgi:1-deoxy-D-xylulose-5-phosphate synthase
VSASLTDVPAWEDMHTLSTSAVETLAASIRAFLIDQVSATGGHLGANLGTVELTLALARAIRSPKAPVIWDTGHQAYTHKLLTGRASRFGDLRRRHGMSGFPSRAESPHDLLENSHASVGPAWAYGVAAATGELTVVVIGDGALTGGVAFEALNAIGHRQAPVLVVLNDNGRSYARTATLLSYGEPIAGEREGARPAEFFQSLGLRYHGPVDGHDIADLDKAFRWALECDPPCVVHVRTQKGQGWATGIADEVKRGHDCDAASAARRTSQSWSAHAAALLCDLAASDPRVHVITAAMPDTLGLLPFQRRFPGRFHDLGIAEQACVAAAAGMASQGQRPFFAVVSTFLTRAIDQVLNDVALHRLPVVFLVDRAGVTGPDGPSHHGVYDVGLLRNVPDAEIHDPVTARELADILHGALAREHGPMAIRYPKGAPLAAGSGPAERSGLIRGGADVCLVTHGAAAPIALLAARELQARHGIECAVWRLSQVHPLDEAFINYAACHRLLMPVEEVAASGSLAGTVAAALTHQQDRPPVIRPLTLPSGFIPHGPRDELLEEFGFTVSGIVNFVLAAIPSQ